MSAPHPTQRMRFVGVSTANSSITRIFPRWCEILGLDAELVGLDLPLDATPEQYRAAVRELRDDPACVGALVTTHKIGLYDAAANLFGSVDEFADACGEVSSIVVRDGHLSAAAKDPLTAGRSLEEFLAPDHFASGAEVICLGAGGAGTAIGWYLAGRADSPTKMTFVDTRLDRLQHLEHVVEPRMRGGELHIASTTTADVRGLIEAASPGTLVINATGMGKDRPGSPLPDEVVLPREGIVWELNYRGQLDYLRQAHHQAAARGLTVVDGWRYFIHGWTYVMADVFDVDMNNEVVEELALVAEAAR
ncbi:MAG: shikimate dehydrogenase [Marmoricola sp.]|jgi:shikimate dehydrogenase|nr:shikimate dehydrogenase [Marmoricola sp.]